MGRDHVFIAVRCVYERYRCPEDNVSSKAILISAISRGCCEDNVISLTGCSAKAFLALWWCNHTPGIQSQTASATVRQTLILSATVVYGAGDNKAFIQAIPVLLFVT